MPAFVYGDRVRETSITEGTGSYTLAGNVSGFRTFASGIGGTNVCTYIATMGSQWEVGIGTVSSGTLSRDTILASSNAGAAVNWTAGTKDIRVDVTAAFATQMLKGSVYWGGTSSGSANAQTITVSPVIYEYYQGLMIIFIAGVSNTSAMTLNANSIGADPLHSFTDSSLVNGDVVVGGIYFVVHDGSNFRLLSERA